MRKGIAQPLSSVVLSTCIGQRVRPQAHAVHLHLTCTCKSDFLHAGLGIMDARRVLQGDKKTIKALMQNGGRVLARTVDKDARR